MNTTTFPQNGQEATGLPGGMRSLIEWAEHCGREHARELLGAVVFFQGRGQYPCQQDEAGRAVLAGFLAPLLPALSDALALFPVDAGVVELLIEDLGHGAAMILDDIGAGDGE